MKSAIAAAAFSAAMISLQGCGSGGPSSCTYDEHLEWTCPGTLLKKSFIDIKDGDIKDVAIVAHKMTISDPNGAWTTELNLDPKTCTGQVDFNVPGKPGHPPGNLTLALLSSFAVESSCSSPSNYVLSFSDVGDDEYVPLNQWVESEEGSPQSGTNFSCFPDDQAQSNAFYIDLKSGEEMIVSTDCTGLGVVCNVAFSPKTGDASWTVETSIDKTTCSGTVDFSSMPNPPEQKSQTVTVRVSRWFDQKILMDVEDSPTEYFIEFKNSTGQQINQWVAKGTPGVLPTPAPAPAPVTTAGPTTAPVTTAGPTTAPVTTAAPTTAPVTTAPTTAPATTAGPSPAPATTAGPSPAPAETAEPTAIVVA